MLRVATLELTIAADAEQNLATCLTLVERAARMGAELLILPELGAHRAPASELDGPLLSKLRETAAQHGLHLIVNADLSCADSKVSASGLLVSKHGELLQRSDAQLVDHTPHARYGAGENLSQVTSAEFGKIGLSVGLDCAAMEQARALALEDAQLLCLLFGPGDAHETWLHAAARAVENQRPVLASVQESQHTEQGEILLFKSKIFGADGSELSAELNEGLALHEVVLPSAESGEMQDVTPSVARRPELYRPLLGRAREHHVHREEAIDVAIVSHVEAGGEEAAIESAAAFVRELAADGAQLIVLPELFCFEEGTIADVEAAADWFGVAARRLAEACDGTAAHVVTSLVERVHGGFVHVGVVLGHAGIVARAGQLHVPARHAFAQPSRRFEVLPLPWGRLGLLVGEDALVPEVTRSLALLGADILVAVGSTDARLSLSLRAAALENGLPAALALRAGEHSVSLLIEAGRSTELRASSSEQAVLRGLLRQSADRQQLVQRVQHVLPALVARSVRRDAAASVHGLQ